MGLIDKLRGAFLFGVGKEAEPMVTREVEVAVSVDGYNAARRKGEAPCVVPYEDKEPGTPIGTVCLREKVGDAWTGRWLACSVTRAVAQGGNTVHLWLAHPPLATHDGRVG